MDAQQAYNAVAERYSAISAEAAKASAGYGKSVAQSFGYTEEELAGIPTEANLGLSCGNPLAIASISEGETVIDLGSGAGFDVFLAAKRVGATGRAIGVDMNKDMLALAEKNKAASGATNVEFVEARITSIPLSEAVADVIISNCVINLVPEEEKPLVFQEMHRLLKPGGRVAVSDILAKKPMSEKLRRCAAAYAGCISGASLVDDYRKYLLQAGFKDMLIQDTNADLNVYIDTLPDGSRRGAAKETDSCCAPKTNACCGVVKEVDMFEMASELGDVNLNEWVGSYKIYAVKAAAEE